VRAKRASATAFLGIAVLALIAGCRNLVPVASFTCTPFSGQSPLAVLFDASSSKDPDGTIVSYEWDFGDGSSASGAAVSHTYATASARSYNVVLTVTDNDGNQATASQTVNVAPQPSNSPPVAGFSCDPLSGVAPLEVTFNAASSYDSDGHIVSYYWLFGDGASDTGAMAIHTYRDVGTYTAVLVVTDNSGGADTASRSIVVTGTGNRPPVAAFSFVSDPTDGHSFSFDPSASYDPDGMLTHWTWDFGDGSGLTVSQSPMILNHRYSVAGTYAVTLTVYDNDGLTDAVTQGVTVPAP